jgi:hypothetical protein
MMLAAVEPIADLKCMGTIAEAGRPIVIVGLLLNWAQTIRFCEAGVMVFFFFELISFCLNFVGCNTGNGILGHSCRGNIFNGRRGVGEVVVTEGGG